MSVRFVKVVRPRRDCKVDRQQLEGRGALMAYPVGLYACCHPSWFSSSSSQVLPGVGEGAGCGAVSERWLGLVKSCDGVLRLFGECSEGCS